MTIRNQRFSLLKQPIYSTLNQHLIDYPTLINLSYWWFVGSLAGICLATGIFLAMHHTPHVDLAFNSVEHIMRDVEGGWLLRYMHASLFFLVRLVLCKHKGCFMLRAFIGYVPPWGQMSFWGATVITSLASAIPVAGDTVTCFSSNILPNTNPGGVSIIIQQAPPVHPVQAPPMQPVQAPPQEGCCPGTRTKWVVVAGLAVGTVFFLYTGNASPEVKGVLASVWKTVSEFV